MNNIIYNYQVHFIVVLFFIRLFVFYPLFSLIKAIAFTVGFYDVTPVCKPIQESRSERKQ